MVPFDPKPESFTVIEVPEPPDRAARIRALANEWAKARHSSRAKVVWQDAAEWVDELDRLEAEEREKERNHD